MLKVGVVAMAFSLTVALVVAIAVVVFREKPDEAVASEPVARTKEKQQASPSARVTLDLSDKPPEPTPPPHPSGSEPPEEIAPASQQEPNPQLKSEPEAKAEPTAEQQPESGAKPQPEPKPQPSPQPEADPLSAANWPAPAKEEIEAVSKPRRFNWIPGAIMTLTVEDIGVINAPVMNSDTQQALSRGVGHVPETSLPWDRSPQTNVYLAAHRYGWPGTGSRLLFFNLNRLGRGDEVVLKDRRGRSYRYKVIEKLVVNPNDRWVMGQVVGKHMVTLQTCTPIPTFHKRLVVRAERV